MSQASDTGQPSRYQRSFGGLVGSMIVLVLVVLGIVAFRAAFRDTPEYDPQPVDYRSLVVSIQQAGITPAYPAELPDGWFVKDATFDTGDRPVLDLAMTTSDDHFAGLHEEDEDVAELVDTYVGTDAIEGDPVTLDSAVASRWLTFSDPGGDHGYAAEVGGQTVLVYGSAPQTELQTLVESLTTEPLKP
ncbi:DUF4245 family protein [Nocardioides sp. URHA0032]|uniref:DUF4245 family protein n=1 Tax=Nocardioides sp. URHA0032 TaxID=1380388 RepID=UPI00048BA6CF|nr:DUF4245 family protein [Nocardioides sp. URHA0032]